MESKTVLELKTRVAQLEVEVAQHKEIEKYLFDQINLLKKHTDFKEEEATKLAMERKQQKEMLLRRARPGAPQRSMKTIAN